ncbi:unnamed protein product [Arabis nemorensis]|uniref:Uncharacterized protein n=1 Tax=Arabis nemorensis TaxID=586526 RepID=A0A565BKQ0_9BRAS|nr:unnamed protein product [Arabis nemorensis]
MGSKCSGAEIFSRNNVAIESSEGTTSPEIFLFSLKSARWKVDGSCGKQRHVYVFGEQRSGGPTTSAIAE